jgi:hypothetical protein
LIHGRDTFARTGPPDPSTFTHTYVDAVVDKSNDHPEIWIPPGTPTAESKLPCAFCGTVTDRHPRGIEFVPYTHTVWPPGLAFRVLLKP